MADVADVVVIGGGIGGASLAYGLAVGGLGVVVLEATVEYRDRVRGESMMPWGVAEARTLGVEHVLLDAGAHVAPLWRQYIDGAGEVGQIPMARMVAGVSGTLNLRHPDACQALIDSAANAGARVVRGVRDIGLTAGKRVTVSYATEASHEVTASLVVGADGRSSAVRKQTGISLERQDPVGYMAGLLVDGLDAVPDDFDVAASDGDRYFLMFHQGGGRARLYLCSGLSGQHRFSGADAPQQFLAAGRLSCLPWAEQVVAARPAGPCATYPGDDTWTAAPYAEGIVLVGDAAGHNDPIIGQGLSIALRDARMVRDVILAGGRDRSDFAAYGQERSSRMERLRLIADVIAVVYAEDADNRAARRTHFNEKMATMDPNLFPLIVGAFAGPETIPPDVVKPAVIDTIRGAGTT
jgi:2-polyprenyl-6-methoxyphenol hydroxylase-like FAD-dependent oxidoreductase